MYIYHDEERLKEEKASTNSKATVESNTFIQNQYIHIIMAPFSSSAANRASSTTKSSSPSMMRGSSRGTTTTTKDRDVVLLEDITDIKWKLYGKNEYFTIQQEAMITVQRFIRGCLSRMHTSEMIQNMINEIVEYRQTAIKYAAEDTKQRKQGQYIEQGGNDDADDADVIARLNQHQHNRGQKVMKPWKKSIKEAEDGGYYEPSGTPIEVSLKVRLAYWESITTKFINRKATQYQPSDLFKQEEEEEEDQRSSSSLPSSSPSWTSSIKSDLTEKKSNIYKPWQQAEEKPSKDYDDDDNDDDNDDDDNKEQQDIEELIIDDPEESLNKEIKETRGKGYQRYRSTATGKNKHRPWRDDTNVFDAY